MLTLTIFIGARICEALHNLSPGHVETHCVICQMAHHAPAAGQSAFAAPENTTYSRVALAVFKQGATPSIPARCSRGPPVS